MRKKKGIFDKQLGFNDNTEESKLEPLMLWFEQLQVDYYNKRRK